MSFTNIHDIITKSDKTNKLTSCKVDLLIYSSGGHEFFLQWNKFPETIVDEMREYRPKRNRGPNIKNAETNVT